MRYYSPYAITSDMRGDIALGQTSKFVVPPIFPDPRKGGEITKAFIILFAKWAEHEEKILAQWADRLQELIRLKLVSCYDLDLYDKEAIALWKETTRMAVTMIRAGASPEDIPMPSLPTLFGERVKLDDVYGFVYDITVHLPCKKLVFGAMAPFPNCSRAPNIRSFE